MDFISDFQFYKSTMNVQSDYIHVRTFERATFNAFCFLNYPTACPVYVSVSRMA